MKIVGKYEHLHDGEIVITDPAADTSSKGNGVNNRVFNLPACQLVQVRFWMPAGVYEVWNTGNNCVHIIRRNSGEERVSKYQGQVSTAFTQWLSLVDVEEYYSGKYFETVEPECISYDAGEFLKVCKNKGISVSASMEYNLRKAIDTHRCPFVSDLLGRTYVECAKLSANNSWYMHILSLLHSSDNDGCVAFPGFLALVTEGDSYDIYGLYDLDGPCGVSVCMSGE